MILISFRNKNPLQRFCITFLTFLFVCFCIIRIKMQIIVQFIFSLNCSILGIFSICFYYSFKMSQDFVLFILYSSMIQPFILRYLGVYHCLGYVTITTSVTRILSQLSSYFHWMKSQLYNGGLLRILTYINDISFS